MFVNAKFLGNAIKPKFDVSQMIRVVKLFYVLRICIRDPVPFLPRDPGWVKNSDPGSGMNILDHISESLQTIFWVKNT